MSRSVNIVLTASLLIISVLYFNLTDADTWIQRFFYDTQLQQWLWPRNEPLLQLFLYDGIKGVLIVATLIAIVLLSVSGKFPQLRSYRSSLRVIIASMILIPLTVSLLKATTDIACPRSLSIYNGELPYINLLTQWMTHLQYAVPQRCFPAGHASGGFALLSLITLFNTQKNKCRAVVFALSVGWAMGLYKMAIGDHFFSHTLDSMLIAWLLVNVLILVDSGLFSTKLAKT